MDTAETPPPPGKLAGLAITGIIVVLLAAWIAIWVGMVGEKGGETLVGAFLFLWYWANNEQLRFDRLVPGLVGALVGIAIAWFLVAGPMQMGGAGMALSLAVLIGALYLDVIKAVPIAINAATMLFVTLAAAPLVQFHVNWIHLAGSVVAGTAFFAAAVWLLQTAAARFAAPAA